ncbi:MAG: hypothetical protein HY209_04440 [Candidatus Omnitrophica bacterium]|nr:hypothetical protein [Candidatus Omnitrophota bacterium]
MFAIWQSFCHKLMDTQQKILEYIAQKGKASRKELLDYLGIPSRTLSHYLALLVVSGKLMKTGKHPDIAYTLSTQQPQIALAQPVTSAQPTPQASTPDPPLAGPVPAQEVVIITQPQPVKTPKPAPNPVETLGQELLPNWCQKFGLDPAVVTARYEAVRGFIPGLSPRTKSAKKKLLASLYSGIVLVLCFLSVWATGTGSKRMRWVKIAGLILIAGLMYVIVTHKYHFNSHQNQSSQLRTDSEGLILARLQEQLSTSQDELTKTKDQLADSQNQFSQMKDQLASHQTDLSQTKEQLSSSQSELDKTKEQFNSKEQQLTQEQGQRSSLEQQLQASTQEIQSLQQKVSQLEEQNRALQEQLGKARAELSSVIANEVKQSHKEQIASSLENTPRNDTRIETTSQVGIEQIMDWTKQGMSNQEIIKRIKTSHSTYSLQAEDISYLKEHGVSQEVIQAMSATPH